MEFKHFSHNHGLVFHQVPHHSKIHCSGCKSPGSGNVHVCWQCSYFLHEKCFRASRSLKHPSHPLHPLTLMPFPTHPSGSFFCNSCNLGGDGFSYTCSECEFDIHVHCALTPNANPNVSLSPVPAPCFSVPNVAQNFSSQPQNPIYPPHSATIQSDPQKLPIQPQNGIYPAVPNSTFPCVNPAYPPNTALPNETQNYSTAAYPPNQQNPPHDHPQPIAAPQSFVPPENAPTNSPSPPPQPNVIVPTYSTVANATTYPPPPSAPQPSVSQPIHVQTNSPQLEPHAIIKHFSHPHVLKPMETEQKSAAVCSACGWKLSGSAYCCTESHCTFNLHKACFDSPCEVHHKSHLQHPLTLLTVPPPYSDGFMCNACCFTRKAFAYTCSTCSYNVHIDCVRWTETMTRPDHRHPLTLYYSPAEASQEVTLMCDVCENPVHRTAWLYYCRECSFGTHLECVFYETKLQNVSVGKTEDIKEQYLRMQEQKALLDFQMEMARLNAEFMASIANSWKTLF